MLPVGVWKLRFPVNKISINNSEVRVVSFQTESGQHKGEGWKVLDILFRSDLMQQKA